MQLILSGDVIFFGVVVLFTVIRSHRTVSRWSLELRRGTKRRTDGSRVDIPTAASLGLAPTLLHE